MINAKRLLTSFIALSMTANLFLLSANADEEKDEKAEEKGESVEIKVTGYMADDWLAEFDEFSITFEHDGEEIHGYFDKDNEFERWIELQEGVEYNVTYSKELDGRLIEGFDETFTPSKDKTNYMFIVYPNHEDKKDGKEDEKKDTGEEKSEESTEKNDKEKLDTAVKKLTMSEEELAEYKKQRELVQKFVDVVDSYDNWKVFNYDSESGKTLSNRFINIYDISKNKDNFFGYENEYEKYRNEADFKEMFKLLYLYTNEKHTFGYGGENNLSGLIAFNDETQTTTEFLQLNDFVYPVVLEIWSYSQNYFNEVGEVPDLYAIYLDIKKGVEYEELSAESIGKELSSIENVSSETESEETETEKETSSIADNKEEISSMVDNEAISDISSDVDKSVPNKKTFKDVLKNNIITIILMIGLGGALLYIKFLKCKKNDKNDDY